MKNLSNEELLAQLCQLDACTEALTWVRAQEGSDLRAMWATCPRGSWMEWYAAKANHLTGEAERRRAMGTVSRRGLPIGPEQGSRKMGGGGEGGGAGEEGVGT